MIIGIMIVIAIGIKINEPIRSKNEIIGSVLKIKN
jgi:hypothetical protein